MKLYIAGHSQDEARAVAKIMSEAGHTITSRWLEEDFSKTGQYTDADKESVANIDVEDVKSCDAMVFIASPRRVAGGKFVEAGIAIGLGKKVHILGHRENILMWHPLTEVYASAEDFVKCHSPQNSQADRPQGSV